MPKKVLLAGFGNISRGDDALGPLIAEALQDSGIEGLSVFSKRELQIEDAFALSNYPTTIFADAGINSEPPFEFSIIHPARSFSFSSHGLRPAALLHLSRSLFGRVPQAYLLTVRGYDFDSFTERVSPQAARNMQKAVRFLRHFIREATGEQLRIGAGLHPEIERVVNESNPSVDEIQTGEYARSTGYSMDD